MYRRREAGPSYFWIGLEMFVGGIVVTVATYQTASEQGGTYFVMYGFIIAGLINMVRGFPYLIGAKRPSRPIPPGAGNWTVPVPPQASRPQYGPTGFARGQAGYPGQPPAQTPFGPQSGGQAPTYVPPGPPSYQGGYPSGYGGGRSCWNCGRPVPGGDEVCQSCGAPRNTPT